MHKMFAHRIMLKLFTLLCFVCFIHKNKIKNCSLVCWNISILQFFFHFFKLVLKHMSKFCTVVFFTLSQVCYQGKSVTVNCVRETFSYSFYVTLDTLIVDLEHPSSRNYKNIYPHIKTAN